MRIARLIVPALLTALGAFAMGQSNVPPTATLKFASAKAKPGEKVKATLILGFGEGLHAYQNPPSETYMIPVTVTSSGGIKLLSVVYPKGLNATVGGETKPVKVYQGTVKIPLLLQAPTKPGAYAALLSIRYQQCNDNSCFAPGSLPGTGKFTVGTAVPKA